jgi:hypothetical protein
VLRRDGLEGDAVAEGLELGDGPLALAIGVAPDEVVATQILVVAVIGEQVPSDHQDRVPHARAAFLLPDAARQPSVLGRQVARLPLTRLVCAVAAWLAEERVEPVVTAQR